MSSTISHCSSMNATVSGMRVSFIQKAHIPVVSKTNSMPELLAREARLPNPSARLSGVSATSTFKNARAWPCVIVRNPRLKVTAAWTGVRTALIEEHPEIGAPAHCSGKLQLHAFREFHLPQHLILNTLQAGAFYAPDGTVARVRRAVPDSHVVDRAVFDRWLAH